MKDKPVNRPQTTDAFLKWFKDPANLPAIFRAFFRIRNKKGELVPFTLNKAQRIVLKHFVKAYRSGKLLRFVILKARQKGISTLFEAIVYWLSITNKYFKATIVGHENDASDNLFNMTKRYHDNLGAVELIDQKEPLTLKPEERHNNRKELNFRNLNSVIEIQTAEGGEKVKRSDTIQAAHLTEVAFWRDAKNTLLALLQTIPDQPNTLVVLESTANGIGGPFYNRWKVANQERVFTGDNDAEADLMGATDYIPIFISWLIDDEYTRPFNSEAEKEQFVKDLGNPKYNSYPDEEKVLLNERGATLEHLNWRRFTIKDKCDDDVEMFHQEYPSTPEEAFVTSGRPVFDIRTCNKNLQIAENLYLAGKQPIKRGELVALYDETNEEYKKLRDKGEDNYYDLKKYIKALRFEPSPKGSIKIYGDVGHLTGEKYKYAAGCDVAEGLEQGDYDVIKVLNRKTLEVVLTYHAHIDPDLLANEQHKIWLYLDKDCYFATERNNHGLTTIVTAFKLGVYQYYAEDFEKGYPESTDIVGFKTTSGSRTPAINDLKEAIRENDFIDYEGEFWQECLTFVKNSKGKMQAQDKDRDPATKCFDDRVFAALIMWRCHNWMPNYIYQPPVDVPEWVKKLNRKAKQTSAMSG